MSGYQAIWREPAEESVDIYPGLVVHDGRVSGSITTGRSRLPLWAFVYEMVTGGWDSVEHGYEPHARNGWSKEQMGLFLYDLFEMRGEFARLLLVLAEAERWERKREGRGKYDPPWWTHRKTRKAVLAQLHRCIEALEASR